MRTITHAPQIAPLLHDIRASLETLEGIVVRANPVYDHHLKLNDHYIALELSRINGKLEEILKGFREASVVPAETTEVPPQFC